MTRTMETIAHAIRWLVEGALVPFDLLPPWASLALLGALTGVAMLFVVRWTSPQRLVGRARARMAASIYEMRLYLDHPRQVLAAQGRMIVWTVVYLLAMLPSLLVLAPVLGLLYLHLEVRHGLAPLTAPTTAVIRVEVGDDVAPRDVELEPRGAVAVTARVHANDEHAVYARLAIEQPGTHALIARAGGVEVGKRISAAPGAAIVSPVRRGGLAHLWSLGDEPPPGTGPIRSMSLAYPTRASPVPGPWWLYWLGAATVIALALRRRFDVVL